MRQVVSVIIRLYPAVVRMFRSRSGAGRLTLGQLVVLLQVAEPLFGGGDVVALVLRDVLLAG